MSPRAARMLVRLYPRAWRERYGEEFAELLRTGRGDFGTFANVVWSAACERVVPGGGDGMNRDAGTSHFRTWCAGAPWAMFGLAPVFFLGVCYLVACLILWSGWRIFLPGTSTPFVAIDGLAILYFGLGRWLYYGAPLLVGWATVVVAARQRLNVVWPTVGLVLIALIAARAEVHASRPVPGGAGRVSMDLAPGPASEGWMHALVILGLTLVPWLVWRVSKGRSVAA